MDREGQVAQPPILEYSEEHKKWVRVEDGGVRQGCGRSRIARLLAVSPRMRRAPSLDAAEEEGSAKATLPKDRDALDPPSSIRDNIIAAPLAYLPSQPPSPLPGVTGHPPHPSYDQYDAV
ncbi:hypothetical protein EDB92DRAFT_1816523 [Lactarius akahatsu]|uniref:Uncharacterized protein n=1 Tax=Lactarius akahatsu TaxID=416441 RepID=A0AAD4LF42_9AGAM|nr:hypothetical protein EDB92DRAFT_1816523 [Lactarius akahatsu]